jgi:hypothetical protein|tara:strand:- start:5296 stop:5844 length:549 start_codon:yes stop_codon:yes gene_type:complete
MAPEFNKIKKFFKENDYYVRVSSSHDKCCCIAEFPERTAIKPWIDGKTCLYSIEKSGILYFSSGFPSIKTELDLIEEKNLHIECPSYARRLVIFNDIFNNTTKIGLSVSFILFCNNDGSEVSDILTFTDILNPPKTEEEKELELVLAEFFYLNLENPSEDYSETAEEKNVGQGYRLLKGPFV